MAVVNIPSPTTPEGAFDWLMILIGMVIVLTAAIFYAVGFI